MTTFGQFPQAADAGAAAAQAGQNAAPQCSFYVRAQVTADPPTYRYDSLCVRGDGYGQSGYLVTPYPPSVGDTIYLSEHAEDGRHGVFRVIERSWHHSGHGSTNWPHGSKWPQVGPILTIIVEEAEGPFQNEAETPTEPEE